MNPEGITPNKLPYSASAAPRRDDPDVTRPIGRWFTLGVIAFVALGCSFGLCFGVGYGLGALHGNAQVYHAFGPIELSARLQLFERAIDDPTARSDTRCSIVRATQERPKSSTADRPGFAVAIDHQISKGGATRRVKKLGTNRQVGEIHGSTQAG